MRLKYCIISSFITVTFLLCAAGCYPTGELELPDESVAPAGESLSEEFEGYKLSVSFADDYPTEAPVIKAKLRFFSKETDRIRELFLGDAPYTEEKREQYNTTSMTTEDGAILLVQNTLIGYNAPSDSPRENAQIFCSHRIEDSPGLYKNVESEIDGFSRAEALKQADGLVKALDFGYLGEPEIYAVTRGDMATILSEHYVFDGFIPSEEDGCYYIKYGSVYKDLPISFARGAVEPILAYDQRAPGVEIILTKDRLVEFFATNIFDEVNETGLSEFKCDPRRASAELTEYYRYAEKLWRDEFTNVALVYITSEWDWDDAHEDITYRPLWEFSGRRLISDDNNKNLSMHVDPERGIVTNATMV